MKLIVSIFGGIGLLLFLILMAVGKILCCRVNYFLDRC